MNASNLLTAPHTQILFGSGQEEHTGQIIKNWCGSRVLIHYDRQHVTDPGLLDKIRHSLDEAGVEHCELGMVQKNSRLGLIYRGIEFCKESGVDFILAVGGGSVVNSAKAIAAGVRFAGGLHRMLEHPEEICDALPLGVVVTVPGSGDELSDEITVSEEKHDSRGIKIYHLRHSCVFPCFALCNPAIITSFPKHLGLSFANILIRSAETFFTNNICFELSDSICIGILKTLVEMLRRLQQDPGDLAAKANFMWAGVLAYTGYGLNRSDNLAIERLSLGLEAVYDCSHGQAAALIFPCWLEAVMSKDPLKAAKFASGVFGIPLDFADPAKTAREGIRAVKELFTKLNLPSSFEDFGGSGADIPAILDAAGIKKDDGIGCYVSFSRHGCEVLLSLILTSVADL